MGRVLQLVQIRRMVDFVHQSRQTDSVFLLPKIPKIPIQQFNFMPSVIAVFHFSITTLIVFVLKKQNAEYTSGTADKKRSLPSITCVIKMETV